MKTLIFKPWLAITLLLTSGWTHASASLGFHTQSQSANSLNIELVVSGLEDASAPSLSTYDLDLQFDAAHLAFAGAVFGDPLLGNQLDLLAFGVNATAAELTSPGVLNLFELSLDTPDDLNNLQANSFTLATVSFNILKAGSSQLQIGIRVFDDADGNAIAPAISSATITTVPLPSALWLMLGGLGIVFNSLNRRRACGLTKRV